MTIYLQNPEKTQVAVFDNENQIGAGFINWIELNQEEIDAYLLQQAKKIKLNALNSFYSNQKCWTYTLFSNLTKIYASLTKDADFFAKLLPSCGGRIIQFFNDKNEIINYNLSVEKAINLNYKINAENGTLLKAKKLFLENKINLATSTEVVNAINIENELLNAVERNIDMDKFN